jgi:hypothetical protein
MSAARPLSTEYENARVKVQTMSGGSLAMSPEVKVKLPRLVPRGVTSHEIARDHKVVRCAKDTVAQWNVCYGQARK